MDFLSNGEARTTKFPKEHETVSSASRPMFLYSLPRNNIFTTYRVFRSRMSFSSCLKMTENRNLHNKTRLQFNQNSPPFHSLAINFIKICHKCSKFHKIWKKGDKNLSNFFSSKLFFQSKYFISMPY